MLRLQKGRKGRECIDQSFFYSYLASGRIEKDFARMVLQNIKLSTTAKKDILRYTRYQGANCGTSSLSHYKETNKQQQKWRISIKTSAKRLWDMQCKNQLGVVPSFLLTTASKTSSCETSFGSSVLQSNIQNSHWTMIWFGRQFWILIYSLSAVKLD